MEIRPVTASSKKPPSESTFHWHGRYVRLSQDGDVGSFIEVEALGPNESILTQLGDDLSCVRLLPELVTCGEDSGRLSK